MSSHLSHSSSQAGIRCAFLAGSRRILCFSTSMKVRATKMGTADQASGEVKPAYSLRKASVPRFDHLERTRAGVGHRHALADEVAHITRGMRQREPVEVDHGHPIAQDVDVFRLEVSVSRHDLSRVQRLQRGEYALSDALHPRRELRADPHQDIPVGVKLHLFVLHRQDGDAGYSGFVQFRQPARRKVHRL